VILALTMSLSYAEYQLRLAKEQQKVNLRLNEIEKFFNSTLNDAI